MTTKPYPLRIPNEILALSRLRAREEHLDQTTVLRQFLHTGSEEYVLGLVAEGRISMGKATEMLKCSIYDMHHIAQKHGIQLGATAEQAEKSRGTAKKVLR